MGMSRPIFDTLEDRSLCSVTLFSDAWYVAAESSPTRSLAEAFAGELSSLYAALGDVYDSAFVDTDSAGGVDFGVSLAEQFAAAGDTLSHYQDHVADESHLSTAPARAAASLFCRRCLG